MTLFRLASVILVLSSANSAYGQSMPKAVHKQLGKLVGNWTIETTIDDKTIKEKITVKWSADKNTIHYEGKGENFDTGQPVTFSGILGWDGKKQTVVETNFNSLGGTMNATHNIKGGRWRSPTKSVRIVDGRFKSGKSLRIFKWKSDDEWTVTSTKQVVDGESQEDLKSVFRRIKE